MTSVLQVGDVFRHISVPERLVGQRVIVARPHDGEPVLLSEAASVVWALTDRWTNEADLRESVRSNVPRLAETDVLATAVAQTLKSLAGEGLLERRAS